MASSSRSGGRKPEAKVILNAGYTPTNYLEYGHRRVFDNLDSDWINIHGLRARHEDHNDRTLVKPTLDEVAAKKYPQALQTKINRYFTTLYGPAVNRNQHLNYQICNHAPHIRGLKWQEYAEKSVSIFENFGLHSILPYLKTNLSFVGASDEIAERYGPTMQGVRLQNLVEKIDAYAANYGVELGVQTLELDNHFLLRELKLPLTSDYKPAARVSAYTSVAKRGAETVQGRLTMKPDSIVYLWRAHQVI